PRDLSSFPTRRSSDLKGLFELERLKKFGVSLHDKNVQFFLIAVILFWFKTYITYRIEFNLGIDNELQQFLLFINPISSALFFLGDRKSTRLNSSHVKI